MKPEGRRELRAVGLVLVRVWREASSASGVRARLTMTADIEQQDERSVVTDSIEGATRAVETFLRDFSQPRNPPGRG